MKVVIDTNVLISAVLKDRTPEAVILFIVQNPDFDWIISSSILEEYKGVLQRDKFGFSQDLLLKKLFVMFGTEIVMRNSVTSLGLLRGFRASKSFNINSIFFNTQSHDSFTNP